MVGINPERNVSKYQLMLKLSQCILSRIYGNVVDYQPTIFIMYGLTRSHVITNHKACRMSGNVAPFVIMKLLTYGSVFDPMIIVAEIVCCGIY